MDLMSISTMNALKKGQGVGAITGTDAVSGILPVKKREQAQGTLFESFLNSAIDNIKTTNSYLSDAENEEIKFALGEVDNSHDLSIALQKASTALQYTVAVKNKLLEAYKEIMQMQI